MESSFRVAASVTLYNSTLNCIAAIATYQNQVELVYLIDNSEQPDPTLLDQLLHWPNVRYVGQHGNKGVATALNTAAFLALEAGFDFLLTMDDDTYLPAGAVKLLLTVATDPAYLGRAGIVSGIHALSTKQVAHRPVLFTMTSGNLLNLAIYEQVGPFRDDFFIDHIDHEYGLRLNEVGFQVIELPSVILNHQLGERKASGWGTYQFVSHSPVRGYYMVRNGWVLGTLYPQFRRQLLVILGKELIKAIVFESNRRHRVSMLLYGLRDARRHQLGRYIN